MNGLELAIAHAAKLGMLAALVGLLVRRRARLCLSLVAYLVAALVGNLLITAWPATFWTAWFYVLKEAVYDALKLAIAAELAFRVFHAFPGALGRARVVTGAILAATALVVIYAPPGVAYPEVVVCPQDAAGALWLLTCTALLIVWYRLPVHAFHWTVLVSLALYLGVFTTGLNLLRDLGFEQERRAVSYLNSTAYLVLLGSWAWAAWRPAQRLELEPAVARRLGLETA